MKLLSCRIVAFGKLRDRDIVFEPGVNCILEANGSGKSTVTDFLCAMFYGMDGYTDRTVTFPERQHYLPAASAGDAAYGGTLTFEKDGAEYRIERFFGAKSVTQDRLTVYRNNMPTEELGDCPGVTVFGIDKDSFARTALFRSGTVAYGSTPDLNRALHGTVADVSEGNTAADAAERLLNGAKKLQSKKKGLETVPNLQSELTEVSRRILQLRETEATLEPLYQKRKEQEEQAGALRKERADAAAYLAMEGRVGILQEKKKALAEAEDKLRALDSRYPRGIPGKEVTDLLRAAGSAAEAVGDPGTPGSPAAIFSGDIPEEQDYAETREKIRQLCGSESQKTALEQKLQPLQAEYDRLSPVFSDPEEGDTAAGGPADGEAFFRSLSPADRADLLVSSLQESRNELARAQKEREEEARKINAALPFGAVLLVLSLIFFFAGLFARQPLPAVSVILFVLAAVSLAAGGVLVAVLLHRRKNKARDTLEDMIAARAVDQQRLRILLQSLGYEGEDPMQLYALLQRDRARWPQLTEEREKAQNQLAALTEKQTALREEIDAFLSFHGFVTADLPAAELLSVADRAAEQYRVFQKYSAARQAADACLGRLGLALPAAGEEYRMGTDMDSDRLQRSLLQSELEQKQRDAEAYQREGVPADLPAKPVHSVEETDVLLQTNAADLAALDRRIEEIESETARIGAYEAKERELRDRIAALSHRAELYKATAEAILAADARITEKYIAPVRDRFDAYAGLLGSITGERVTMDAAYRVKTEQNGTYLDERWFSEGQKVLCSLCLRLAMLDNIYPNEKPFLVFDDPFAGLDADKMDKAARLLCEVGKDCQILYFCCHESRIIGKEE